MELVVIVVSVLLAVATWLVYRVAVVTRDVRR
jgi:hypothetical protein